MLRNGVAHLQLPSVTKLRTMRGMNASKDSTRHINPSSKPRHFPWPFVQKTQATSVRIALPHPPFTPFAHLYLMIMVIG